MILSAVKIYIAGSVISLKNDYSDHTPPDIKFLISNIVRDYGKLELRDLLEFVYFETEPMMNAETRKEILDFNCIMPEEYYQVKKLDIDKKTKRKLNQEFKDRVEAFRGKRD